MRGEFKEVLLADNIAGDYIAELDFNDARRRNARRLNWAAQKGDDSLYASCIATSDAMARVAARVNQARQAKKS